MDRNRIPKQTLQYGPKGRRNIGRPRKRSRDQLHLEDQGTGNTPNPSWTWWWWWWWWWQYFPRLLADRERTVSAPTAWLKLLALQLARPASQSGTVLTCGVTLQLTLNGFLLASRLLQASRNSVKCSATDGTRRLSFRAKLTPEGLCFRLADRLVEPVVLMTSQTTTRGSILGSTSLSRVQTGSGAHPAFPQGKAAGVWSYLVRG
jgi:hypothetical protein